MVWNCVFGEEERQLTREECKDSQGALRSSWGHRVWSYYSNHVPSCWFFSSNLDSSMKKGRLVQSRVFSRKEWGKNRLRYEGRIGLRDQEGRDRILTTDGPGTLRGNRQEIKVEGTDWKKTEGPEWKMYCRELVFFEYILYPTHLSCVTLFNSPNNPILTLLRSLSKLASKWQKWNVVHVANYWVILAS